MMDAHRREWNLKQKGLRRVLTRSEDHTEAMELFLGQHAMVHAAEMSHAGLWSFEDEILEGVNGQQMRLIPKMCDHSIAWIFWHMTRIEDVTMNMLVAGRPQILLTENWLERLQVVVQDTGNAMTIDQVKELSVRINLEALLAYRLSVGRRTREIIRLLLPDHLKKRVSPDRLNQITRENAVVEAAKDILEYWGGLTIAGLLLMPPTRHSFIHLNEALRVKQKFG
jgi:hypothetical protein